jgi:dTDP-4-amino-4,6-dideoxygalactose transaminase
LQFIDLKHQYSIIKPHIDLAIKKVLNHGQYIQGPEVFELEAELAAYTSRKHCISCASGTDALLMSLLAQGIGQGDAVFTTPFTFIATAEVIQLLGATPIFVDILDSTFNIDPEKLEIAINECQLKGGLISKAIIPVDIFGLLADYEMIEKIGNKLDLCIIEDAAQSFGGKIKNQKACSFGDIGTTSFFPAKPLGCYGDGGAIFTNDQEIAELLISIRNHGQGKSKYNNIRIGLNGRIDTIQAAIILEKMKIFPKELGQRNAIAKKYSQNLNQYFKCQHVPEGYRSAWAQYSVLAASTKERSICMEKLRDADIPTAIYYPRPLHLQDAFSDLNYSTGDFPVAESISQRIFSIPMHPYLSDDNISKICDILISCKELAQ